MLTTVDEIKNLIEKNFKFLRNMGLKTITLEPNRVKLMLPKSGNENHLETIWAGALFTLAEVPGGALVLTTFDTARFYPVVTEMNIKFLKPATTNVTIEISMDKSESDKLVTTADENGKAAFTLSGEILDEDKNVVAVSRGFYQLRKL